MAELPDLGKHCQVDDCKQLDFLPFKCDGCSKIFCSEHRVKEIHYCIKVNGESSGCEYTGVRGYGCGLDGCSNRELTPITCCKCQQNFCLSHRHPQDHCCTKLETDTHSVAGSKTAQHVNQIIANKPAAPRKVRGAKSRQTAAKVALMKMKLHAVGDQSCPPAERTHLRVVLPLRCDKDHTDMFFSKTWSVGRVIDSIASRLGLRNDNNIQTAQKLRLFSTDDGAIYRTDNDLDSFLQGELIYNGSAVILEYVDNQCIKLEDLSKYKLS